MTVALSRVEYAKLMETTTSRKCRRACGVRVRDAAAERRLAGADFIAQHIDERTFIKVQLKSRPAFAKKHHGNLFIAFFNGASWYLYPHEEVLAACRVSVSARLRRPVE